MVSDLQYLELSCLGLILPQGSFWHELPLSVNIPSETQLSF